MLRLIQGAVVQSSLNSVFSAWIGVNELNGALSFASDPERTLSYVPTWVSPTDATKKCVTVLASNGDWEASECNDSSSDQATLCRIPPMDEFGYNLGTGKYRSKETCVHFI